MKGRAGGAWVLVLSVALIVPIVGARPVADRWYEHYDRALDAIDASDWERAITELDSALSQRDESGRSARTYGVRFVRYFPYYYQGIALFSMGRDADALRLLHMELEQGEIQRSDEFDERLRVLLSALEDPPPTPAADDLAAEEIDALYRRGVELSGEGRYLEAMETLSRVVAVAGDHPEAAAALREVQLGALQEELGSLRIQTRGEATDPAAVSSPDAVALFEAKAREIFQRGVEMTTNGNLEAALVRFELTIAFLGDEGWTGGELYADAVDYRELVSAELRRSRESELRAAAAARSGLPPTPPEIMLISPSDPDDAVTSDIVRLQGVAHDAQGVDDIAILVNGQEWGAAEVGVRSRNIRVTARASETSSDGLGTFAQFSKDLVLVSGKNEVVVRVTDTSGQASELRLELELERGDGQTYAAVVGIGNYQDESIPDLDYAVADARAVEAYLRDNLGVPESNVYTLIDEEATYAALRRLFRTELRRRAKERDQVVIYFAGHGAPDQFGGGADGDGVEKYFLPVDADGEDVAGTGYPMQEVAESLARLGSRRVVYIADACFSGASGGRTFGAGSGTAISDGFLSRLTGNAPGRVILSASGANEPSLESQALGHGVFTYFLLDGLKGGADMDDNRLITVSEVFAYLSRQVPENTGRRQHPTMSGALGGDMVLGRVAPR